MRRSGGSAYSQGLPAVGSSLRPLVGRRASPVYESVSPVDGQRLSPSPLPAQPSFLHGGLELLGFHPPALLRGIARSLSRVLRNGLGPLERLAADSLSSFGHLV